MTNTSFTSQCGSYPRDLPISCVKPIVLTHTQGHPQISPHNGHRHPHLDPPKPLHLLQPCRPRGIPRSSRFLCLSHLEIPRRTRPVRPRRNLPVGRCPRRRRLRRSAPKRRQLPAHDERHPRRHFLRQGLHGYFQRCRDRSPTNVGRVRRVGEQDEQRHGPGHHQRKRHHERKHDEFDVHV